MSQEGENRLPSECWLMIFSLLSDADLKALSLACKAFWANSNSSKKSLKVIHPEICMLSQHLKRFSQLKNIDLFHFEGDVVEAIREIGRSRISLEALDISTDQKHFVELMKSVRGWRPSNLKALKCEFDDSDVVHLDVKVIANTFPNLEQLRIVSPYSGNPIVFRFESLDSKLEPLKKIHLYSCNVSDQFIIALSLNCVLLKDVTIFGFHSVTRIGVDHLLRNWPNLEALSLNDPNQQRSFDAPWPVVSSSINIENSISHAKALTSLVLNGARNTDKILKAIAKAKLRLNKLGLLSCEDLTVSSLVMVLSNHLTELTLQRVDLGDDQVKQLLLNGDVSKVTSIEINNCPTTSSTLFLLLNKCPSLVEIKLHSIYHQPWLQNTLLPINQKTRSLYLYHCHQMYDAPLKQLAVMFPNLKVLHLNSLWSITSNGVKAILKSCKHITELGLRWYGKAKMFEANDPQIVELNLEVLSLSDSMINDEGLAALANKCPRLLSLDLSYCRRITIEGIKQVVQNIKTLTSLNLMKWNHWDHQQNYGALLEWMLSTGNLASLNKIFLLKYHFTREQRDKFLYHGCLLSSRGE